MKKLLPVLAAAALTLTACGGQVAARVGDTTITVDRVDALTDVECALVAAAGQGGSTQIRQRRQVTLNRLIDREVLLEVAREHGAGYDREAYLAQLGQMRNDLAPLPEEQREVAEEFFSDYIKRVLQLSQIATAEVEASGAATPGQEQVQQAMQALYAEARGKLDIDVNPSFAPDEHGVPGAGDGSLSAVVSDYAKQAADPEGGTDYLAGLPKNQLCG